MAKMSRREMLAALASTIGFVALGKWIRPSRTSQRKDESGIAHAKPSLNRGDRIKVNYGTFRGLLGEVKDTIASKGLLRVELTISHRPVPVELEYWQVERA